MASKRHYLICMNVNMISYTINKTEYQTQIAPKEELLRCSICKQQANKNDLAVGPINALGELVFICNSHQRSSHQLINMLIDYIVDERHHFNQKLQPDNKVSPDAWFLY